MTPLLQQFLSDGRDALQGIGERLMQLEATPSDAALMGDLFRAVHTLKGNCGLFDFPELSRVLHAAEDVMDQVRGGQLVFTRALADALLEAMDFVSALLDEIQHTGVCDAKHASTAVQLAASLHVLSNTSDGGMGAAQPAKPATVDEVALAGLLARAPEASRREWHRQVTAGAPLHWLRYAPDPECFFRGEDPLHQARQTPGLVWHQVTATQPWPALAALDAYRCVLQFDLFSTAPRAELETHYRYVPEQLSIAVVAPHLLAPTEVDDSSQAVLEAQLSVLQLADEVAWLPGRLKAVAASLRGCFRATGREALLPALEVALGEALSQRHAAPLHAWLQANMTASPPPVETVTPVEPETRVERREEPSGGGQMLKVDPVKIDRLLNLIGELVVAKNGLPYLAARAETVFGVRELSREIKNQYAVINRLAGEMQDAIMQVRMLPVSFVFQRFPRLVRDLSRKLGKEVSLVMEGEDTEADKNIIEALADPLIHIVRNCLDHGLESPDERRAAGKPPEGRVVLRAAQEADRVVIEISDDGRGIDPAAIKRKAYEKGLIDEATLERITDAEAVNLVFAAGFSTAEVVSDLSGRGVGMDVVRSAVERVHGSVALESTLGQGTRLRLSLPLSMAVTNVMIIESDHQRFGVPMDMVLETVRVPRKAVHGLKNHLTTVLRGRVVPLRALNELLAVDKPQRPNAHDELATLVIRLHGEPVGVVVDDFREVVDVILKPLGGVLAEVPGYSGSALLGDGSVLMVLSPRELL